MKEKLSLSVVLTTTLFLLSHFAGAQSKILITNVNIINGKDNKITSGHVYIENNLIRKISTSVIAVSADAGTIRIDGKGKYLIPGLIDNHVHLAMNTAPQEVLLTLSAAAIDSLQLLEGRKMLLRGFTTIRDLGGPVFNAKKEFDKGAAPGPRIYPSGAMISQTSGHGDARMPYEKSKHYGGEVSKAELLGVSYIADGVPEVLNAVRESLRSGATQIKVHAGGGAATLYDPLDVSQYTFEELKAAVDAADDWGTYVCVHAYTSKAVKRSITAGVKVIEHGQLLDDPTLKLMAEKGIFLSLQALDPAPPQAPEVVKVKKQQVIDGTDLAFRTAKKYKIKLLWGTDYLFDPTSASRQSTDILKLKKWFTPYEILKLITYDNAKVFQLSGNRNPYQQGKLGEIAEGAYADLILVNGNPFQDIDLIAYPEKNFEVIIKDGKIYKNKLSD